MRSVKKRFHFDLSHLANLDGSNLYWSNLRACNLEGVDFSKVRGLADERDSTGRPCFRGTDFSKANLKGASFAGCDLFGTLFSAANLEGADFSHTTLALEFLSLNQLKYEPFKLAQFSKNGDNPTKFVGTTLPFSLIGLDWSCKDLTEAKIGDVPQDLTGLQASHLTAKGIDLSNRNLTNAVFDNADLTNAIFADSDLTGASFKGAKLYGATFSYATLNRADFTGAQLGTIGDSDTPSFVSAAVLDFANMRDAVFTHANLDECILTGAQWYGDNARADNAILTSAKIAEANLSGINLKQATLDKVDFADTILVNANLSGATATRTSFSKAHLQGANFTGSKLNGADFTGAAVALEKGVPLFLVDDTFIAELDVPPPKKPSPPVTLVSANLKKAFADKGYSLLAQATITIITAGTEWTVANADSAMPLADLGTNYETFKILKTTTDRLQVFGSALWVTQVNGDALQSRKVTCLPTVLDQTSSTMDDSLTFPNGHKLREFNAKEFTWEQMMTAHTPLTPPKCVYTPGSWGCHPTRRDS